MSYRFHCRTSVSDLASLWFPAFTY
jgi:hypothetical protein